MATIKIFPIATCSALLALSLAHCPARAEDSQQVGGPAVGLVLDKAAGVRPILGILGAATVGPPILPMAGFNGIVLSPQRDYALALTDDEHRLMLLRNLSGTPNATLVDAAAGASRIVVSPPGDSAVLYYGEARRVEVIVGLPDSPSLSWALDLPGFVTGLAAIAVSDGGSAVLAAAEGEPASLFVLAPEVGCRFLQSVAGSPSVTFLTGGLDAVIADGASSQVFLVRDILGQAQIVLIGGQAQGVSRPVAVAAASDGRVLVANADPAGVVSLSLAGEAALAVPCACAPTGLERLAGGALFRLTEVGEAPVWLVDGSLSPPRLAFVPDQPSQPQARSLRAPVLKRLERMPGLRQKSMRLDPIPRESER